MAAPAIIGIIAAAAQVFAKQLGQTVGVGLVETLFNQAAIARDLEAIKAKLDALDEFVRNELPGVIEKKVELALARDIGYKIIEKADTINGSIATLRKSRAGNEPAGIIQNNLAALVAHAEQIAEMGGTLMTYGQPFYASVGVAFGAMLKAYEAAIDEAPSNAASLRSRLLSWQPRVASWIDPARPSSLAAAYIWLEGRHAIGLKVLPSFWTWDTHIERRVVLSWVQLGENTMVSGGWWGFYKRPDGSIFQNGNLIGQMLSGGMSLDAARAAGVLNMTMPDPEWWAVKHNTPPTRADYDMAGQELGTLQTEFERYPTLWPAVKGAVDLISEMQRQITVLLDNTVGMDEQFQFVDSAQLDVLVRKQVAQALAAP